MGNSTSKKNFTAILEQLASDDLDPADQNFWDMLWKTPLCAEEIFDLMTPQTVRTIISQRPGNLQTLVTQAIAQLYQVVETPYPIYFDQALNCARILARLLPFLLENTSSSLVSPALRSLLWRKQQVPRESAFDVDETGKRIRRNSSDDCTGIGGLLHAHSSHHSEGKRSIEKTNDDHDHEEEKIHNVDDLAEEEEEQETEPLAVILVNSIFHLLFLPDFTIEDPNMDFNEEDLDTQTFKSALMWAPGVGCGEKALANSSQYDKNRIEVLRLLVAAFSDPLYQNPDTFDSCESLWLEVATSPDVPYGEICFYSLMNVVLGYDPTGYGVPYGKIVSEDTAFSLMEMSVQALIILLDYGHPIMSPVNENVGIGQVGEVLYLDPHDDHAHGYNIFRKMLRDITDPQQLNFIFRGFTRLLNNVHQALTTFLPNSATMIRIDQELMVLLWKCLEEIPAFLPFILKENSHCDANQLVVPVCFFLLDGRNDPAKLGMLYLCTFVLLKLSGERGFCVGLNSPYKAQLPVDMPLFTGSHADLLVVVLHKLMVDGIDKLSSLYTCFLTIICNISPYCKGLCAPAAQKLVNLVELFTTPRVLFASESNYTSVVMLLESINNLIQYQYEGNFNLVFSILTRRKVFEWLNSFSSLPAEKKVDDPSTKGTESSTGILKQVQSSQIGDKKTITIGDDVLKHEKHEELSTGPEHLSVINMMEEEREFSEEEVKENEKVPSERNENISSEISSGLEEKRGQTGDATVELDAVTERKVDDSLSKEPSPPSSSQQSQGQSFVPTPEWVSRVKSEMPLQTIMRLLRYLVPLLEELAASPGKQRMGELSVLGFLRRTTMVGILPVPHPIVIRKYQPNKYTSLWFTAFMWGVIFLHNQEPLKLYDGRGVRLFIVQGGEAK